MNPAYAGRAPGAVHALKALPVEIKREGQPCPRRHHQRRGGHKASRPQNHGKPAVRRALLRGRGAGCGRLYGRLQPWLAFATAKAAALHIPIGAEGRSGGPHAPRARQQTEKRKTHDLHCHRRPLRGRESTLARRLAKELGYVYVDTGAMFRAVGLYALAEGRAPKGTALPCRPCWTR